MKYFVEFKHEKNYSRFSFHTEYKNFGAFFILSTFFARLSLQNWKVAIKNVIKNVGWRGNRCLCFKATSHSTIFDIPMRLVLENHRRRFAG